MNHARAEGENALKELPQNRRVERERESERERQGRGNLAKCPILQSEFSRFSGEFTRQTKRGFRSRGERALLRRYRVGSIDYCCG